MHTNISHTLPQWLEFGFVAAIDAVFLLFFFLVSLKLLRSVLHHSPDLLLPDLRSVTSTTLYFKLTLALTSLLITTFFFAYFLTATIDNNGTLLSWRLNFESHYLILQFILVISCAAIIVHIREFPNGRSHLSVGLSSGVCFGISNMHFIYSSNARILEGKAMLPNDILYLGTMLITVILIRFGLKGRHGSKGADELGDLGVVGEEV